MKAKDVMTVDVETCRDGTNVAEVAKIMWDRDCGVVPVVDAEGKVTGVLTDRDICIALATRNCRASELTAGQVKSGKVHGCGPEDELEAVLKTMQTEKVQRLPVIGADGAVKGILSMHDIVLCACESRGKGLPTYERVMGVLKGICGQRQASRKLKGMEVA